MLKKEDFPYDKTHQAIELKEAIGKEVLCEDGTIRKVESIVHCAGSFGFAVINEDLEAERTGFMVHLLKLFSQLRGQPPPSEEDLKKFDEIAKSFDFEYVGREETLKFPKKRKKSGAFQLH